MSTWRLVLEMDGRWRVAHEHLSCDNTTLRARDIWRHGIDMKPKSSFKALASALVIEQSSDEKRIFAFWLLTDFLL